MPKRMRNLPGDKQLSPKVTNMTQPNQNQQAPQKPPVPSFNRAQTPQFHPQTPQLTEERIKEVIMETLIKLDLIPRAQKKKAINIE